jgi:hypothetical protein
MQPFENYVYPPRPENTFPTSKLKDFENMKMFIAQPKMNGSSCVSICNNSQARFYNRHKETFAKFVFSSEELLQNLKVTGLTIFCGEYLNKSQDDEFGNTNGRYILFDILSYDGKSLVHQTVEQRQALLRSIFEIKEYGQWIDRISQNLFIVKNFETNFEEIWNKITPYPVYEGLVLKKKNGKLRPGTVKNNNTDWQIKCRKPTKNYTH